MTFFRPAVDTDEWFMSSDDQVSKVTDKVPPTFESPAGPPFTD